MVVIIISLMVGVTFPAVTSGVDSLRLRGAGEEAAALLTAAINRAERRRVAVEVMVSPMENSMILTSVEPGYRRFFQPGNGVIIAAVLPPIPTADVRQPRQFLVYPGGSAPRLGLILTNARGTRRLVRLDPITGVAQSRTLEPLEEMLP